MYNFEFGYPWLFLLLVLPMLVYWLAPPLRIKSAALFYPNYKRAVEYTGEEPRVSALIKRRGLINSFLMFLVWVLFVGALASPQLVGEPEMKVKTSRNFLIVADISFSMATQDWEIEGEKVRRWDAVKSVMHEFIQRREGDRMGLIFFGSNAYIQSPFTPDLGTVDILLEEADVGFAGQLTNIGKAIAKGMTMFEDDSTETKVMLLLTDGIDSGTDILPLDAAELAQTDSVIVYTIGIGDPESQTSDLDEETLRQIAEMTGGQYFLAIDKERLEEIYAELDRLEPIEYEAEENVPVRLLYFYPLAAGVGLMLILSFLSITVSVFVNSESREEAYV